MLLDVIGVPHKPLEIEIGVVVEALACRLVQHRVERCALVSVLALSMFGEDSGLGGREHAVEATQDRDR